MRTIIFFTAVLLGIVSAQEIGRGYGGPSFSYDDYEDTNSNNGYGGAGGFSNFDDWSRPAENQEPSGFWSQRQQDNNLADPWAQFMRGSNPYKYNGFDFYNGYDRTPNFGYGQEFRETPNFGYGQEFEETPNFGYGQEFGETPNFGYGQESAESIYPSSGSYPEYGGFYDQFEGYPQATEDVDYFRGFGPNPESSGEIIDPFQGNQESTVDSNNSGSNYSFEMEMPDPTDLKRIVSALAALPKGLKQKMRDFYVSQLEPHFDNYPSAMHLSQYTVKYLDKMIEANAAGKRFDENSFDKQNANLRDTINPSEIISAVMALPRETKVATKELYELLLPHFQNYPYANKLFSAKIKFLNEMIKVDDMMKALGPDAKISSEFSVIPKTVSSLNGFEDHGPQADNLSDLTGPFKAPCGGVDHPKLLANSPATPIQPKEAASGLPSPALSLLADPAAAVPVEEPKPLTKNQKRNKKRAEQRRRKAERERNASFEG